MLGTTCKFRHDLGGPTASAANPRGALSRNSSGDGTAEGRRVLVLNVPSALNNMSKLNELFSPCGRITNIQIGTDTRGKANPLISVIEFATREAAELAHGKVVPWDNGAVRWTKEYEMGGRPVAKVAPYSTAGAAAASSASAANAATSAAASATSTSAATAPSAAGVAPGGPTNTNTSTNSTPNPAGTAAARTVPAQARPTPAAPKAKAVTAREAFKAQMSIIERLLQTQRNLIAKLEQHQNNATAKTSLKGSLDKVVKLIKEARVRAEGLAQAATGSATKAATNASPSQPSAAPTAAAEGTSSTPTHGVLKSLRVSGFSDVESLSAHFAQYGVVSSIYSLGESRAIVTFSTANQAQAALRDGHDLGHDSLSLALCKEPSADDPPSEYTPVLVRSQRRASALPPPAASESPTAAAATVSVNASASSNLSYVAVSAALESAADAMHEESSVTAATHEAQAAGEAGEAVAAVAAVAAVEAVEQSDSLLEADDQGTEGAELEEGMGADEEEDLLAGHEAVAGLDGEADGQLDEDLLED
jgi:hypothetical protein